MKILLTGANGFVGARIRAAAPVICAPSLRGAEKEDIDRLIDTVQPDAILHTAAISDIGACAKDPEGSYHANVLVPEYLAKAANGAKLVLFSSDQVYSGQRAISRLRKTTLRPQISTPKRSWKWKTAFSRSTRTPSCCVRRGCMTCPCSACRTAATSSRCS